jgi:hypothetical protein
MSFTPATKAMLAASRVSRRKNKTTKYLHSVHIFIFLPEEVVPKGGVEPDVHHILPNGNVCGLRGEHQLLSGQPPQSVK